VAGGIGMLVDVAVFVALSAAGIALGVSTAGADITTPVVGSLVMSVYAAALVGIGLAVGGIFGTRFAGPFVAAFVLVTWFVQTVGGIMKLPDPVMQLTLTSHYGQPFVGVWDPAGIVGSIVLAVVGIAVGAWAFARRDLRA
jgi:putative exporter of polyketide antibiotics